MMGSWKTAGSQRNEKPSRLVIIGNGFDLAHGLKTGYKDFVTSYLELARTQFFEDFRKGYNDDLIELTNSDPKMLIRLLNINDDSDIFDWIDKYMYTGSNTTIYFSFNSIFFKKIYDKVKWNWVDIENEYFRALMSIHKRDQAANEGVMYNAKEYSTYTVKQLNKEFECLRKALLKYLRSIDKPQVYDEFLDFIDGRRRHNQLFLSFNYTDTIQSYVTKIESRAGSGVNTRLVYIHGSLAYDNNGDPIFGLGDEHHSELATFKESDQLTELYKYNKSNLYFLESNYKILKSFITADDYTVEILGSSCGLSDRTLFKEILDNDKCKSIMVYHYRDRNDYFNKTIELTRHFDNPQHFRDKMIEYSHYHRIPTVICNGLKDIEKRLLKVS